MQHGKKRQAEGYNGKNKMSMTAVRRAAKRERNDSALSKIFASGAGREEQREGIREKNRIRSV